MRRFSGSRLLAGVAITAVFLLLVGLPSASYLRSVEGNDLRFWIIAVYSSLRETQRQTADAQVIRLATGNPLGVNTFLEQEVEPEKRRRTLDLARQAGFNWIRQQFPWAEIEPEEKGRFVDPYGENTWLKYDAIVGLATEMGIHVIARLDTTPKWARPGNPHPNTPPDDLEDFGDYVEAVVSRYRGRVRFYQIWNEPNLSVEWGADRPVDPEAATELLRVAHTRAKGADPSAVIVAPALAPTISDSPEALSELVFLDRMYAAGAAAYFDIGSVQVYGLANGPDDRRLDPDRVNVSRAILYREIMVRHGDAKKPVWASEVGWNAPGPGAEGDSLWGVVTPDQQARYTVRLLERARTEWPWMGVMNLWFLRRPEEGAEKTIQGGFRMLDHDFRTRPVYTEVRSYARRLGYVMEHDPP